MALSFLGPKPQKPKRSKRSFGGSFLVRAFRKGVAQHHDPGYDRDSESESTDTHEESMETDNTLRIETVAEVMDSTDAFLDSLGISIAENIETPKEYIETLASILDENELDEDVEEVLCLSVALVESLLSGESAELDERSMRAKLDKAWRRSMEKLHPDKKHWPLTGGKRSSRGHDPLASKEPGEVLRKSMDKQTTKHDLPPKPSAPPQKKQAAAEDVEDIDALVNSVVEVVEAAGYAVPDDLLVADFLDSAEELAATDAAVAEGLGGALGKLAVGALKSKTAAWATKKLAKAGTSAAVRKLGQVGKPPVAGEDVDELLATMVEVLTNNGYEFEGSEEAFDPESFVEAAGEIAETDEDLAEDLRAWLKNASESVKTEWCTDEASQIGQLPKSRHSAYAGPGRRKDVKRTTRKLMRRLAKQDPEKAPTKLPMRGYAD